MTDRSIPSTADLSGFSYLKRDLVRLVGVLCHKDKTFQDRIRVCGGIPVIMNMCVVDERNPCTSTFRETSKDFMILDL